MTQIAPFEFTLPADGRLTITHPGKWVTVTRGDYPFVLSTDKGSKAEIERGLGVELEPFTQLYVHNSSDYSQTIKLYIGDVYVRDSRLSVPSDTVVGVVDGGKVTSLESKAFYGAASQNPVAAEYSHIQLFNPSGSGINCVLSRLTATINTSSTLQLRSYNTQLTTDSGNIINKLTSSSVSPECIIRQDTDPTILGDFCDIVEIGGDTPHVFELDEPIILTPGYGVHVTTGNPNVKVRLSFQWHEELA